MSLQPDWRGEDVPAPLSYSAQLASAVRGPGVPTGSYSMSYSALPYAQGRYGMQPINAMGHITPQTMLIPYMPGAPDMRQYSQPSQLQSLGMAAGMDGSNFNNEAAALAEGLENTLVLRPQQHEFIHAAPQYYTQAQPFIYYAQPGPAGGMPSYVSAAPLVSRGAGVGPSSGRFPGESSGGRGGGGGGRGRGSQQDRRVQQRKKKVQRGLEDNVRRTVYVSYINQLVTEELLASFFEDCGTVNDCRICGDPNSAMRFSFIEFADEESARRALTKTGSSLGNTAIRVLPSKTAIVPVNKELMPQSEEELERCSRTVYVGNIDKKVDKADVIGFFEQLCGQVSKIHLLGDFAHATRIAFVEFVEADSAIAALNCSGAMLGSLPLRVAPSKTPVRNKDGDDQE